MLAHTSKLRHILVPGQQRLTDRIVQQALGCRDSVQTFSSESHQSEKTSLIVGGGRGLGLEFVKQLLERSQDRYMHCSTLFGVIKELHGRNIL